MAWHHGLLPDMVLLSHPNKLDLDWGLDDLDLNSLFVARNLLQVCGADPEILLQFVVQDFHVVVGKEHMSRMLALADGTKAAHRGLENENFGLGLSEQADPEQ